MKRRDPQYCAADILKGGRCIRQAISKFLKQFAAEAHFGPAESQNARAGGGCLDKEQLLHEAQSQSLADRFAASFPAPADRPVLPAIREEDENDNDEEEEQGVLLFASWKRMPSTSVSRAHPLRGAATTVAAPTTPNTAAIFFQAVQ
eukprot:g17173.t1